MCENVPEFGAETLRKNRGHTQSGLPRFFQSVSAQRIAQDCTSQLPILGLIISAVWLVGLSQVYGADGTAFFESNIRPLLVERCYECHSAEAKKVKGGLLLDSRTGWAKGGENGPAIVPGKPAESLLIKAVLYADSDLQMPPKRRLEPEQVAALQEWIRMGAPDPRVDGPGAKAASVEKARKHWAFQQIARPAPPAVHQKSWPRNELDRFVLAGLERAGLRPNSPADPRALIRRVYFDLIGLPPTFEEVETFAAKPGDGAFARMVDDLLARPEYGQRWARHWLDVARYADTIEQSTDSERRIPFAHTYRDYVIDALNGDKPFDRFIVEQIAADRLPSSEKPDLRALGFLRVGRRFNSNAEGPVLVIDDQIDVIGRGFLGLTLACARCHDHKFDPIPTSDYYSLFGILGSVEVPLDLPEVRRVGAPEDVTKYLEERANILKEYDAHVDDCFKKANLHFREFATDYLEYLVRSSPNHRTTEGYVPHDTPHGLLYYEAPVRWAALLAQSKERGEPFFKLWHRLMALRAENFSVEAKPILAELTRHPEGYHPAIVAAFAGKSPASMLEVAAIYGEVVKAALKDDSAGSRQIVELIFGPDSPVPPHSRQEMAEDIHRFLTEKCLCNRADGEKGDAIRQKLLVLEAGAPVERALFLRASAKPLDPHVLVRGDFKQPGAAVSRHFLSVLSGVDDRTYLNDGRLEFAQAIASAKNPLTARVIVNRVWQQHFGHGLVESPDDFGIRGQAPANPELLDYLATWFMEHGWSLKALHREILNSATWQQSSAPQRKADEKDPSDRLWWRMPPRRLEFEPLRDTLLRVAGRLDTHEGGRGAPLNDQNLRRAVYGYTDRFRIPSLLRNFDVANPDTSISHRSETLVPLQALYFLNSQFVRQQAEAVLARSEVKAAKSVPERIIVVFKLVLSRQPTRDEIQWGETCVGVASLDQSGLRAWATLVQGLLSSNEFIYVD
jgi:hypothetical protein